MPGMECLPLWSLTLVAFLSGCAAQPPSAGASGRAPGGARSAGGPTGDFREGAGETDVAAAADPAAAQTHEERIVLAQRKRVMGRLRSLEMVERVALTIRPIVDRSLEQPSIQASLDELARREGMTPDGYRADFAAKQEADLLLESGGDPEARSVSDAIGVAQFLAGTGRRCGLRVDLARSEALSRRIAALDRSLEWLAQQPPAWRKAPPPGVAAPPPPPGASQLPGDAPGPAGPGWDRDTWIRHRRRQRETLAAQRRRVDERYDPQRAIPVQTRYLVKLALRFGGIDWALQAYHGGEGGAERTIGLFAREGPVRLASRGAAGAPRRLTFAHLYQRTTPAARPATFSYLFGRSDDHRYYWWKVLMAERALRLYREDREEFVRQWKSLRPGQAVEAAWYQEAAPHSFAGEEELAEAFRTGKLVRLPPSAAALGIVVEDAARREADPAGRLAGLRPEAMAALLQVARIFRSQGGQARLRVTAMTHTNADRVRWNARYPLPPRPPEVPEDEDFHPTGLVFDLAIPQDRWERKVLEYALGRLSDALCIAWRRELQGGARFHVVVNPAARELLLAEAARIAR